jgi:hypothetical protein
MSIDESARLQMLFSSNFAMKSPSRSMLATMAVGVKFCYIYFCVAQPVAALLL